MAFAEACRATLGASAHGSFADVEWPAIVGDIVPPDLRRDRVPRLGPLPSASAVEDTLARAGVSPFTARRGDVAGLGQWAVDLAYSAASVRLRSRGPSTSWVGCGLGALWPHYQAFADAWGCGSDRSFKLFYASFLTVVLLEGRYRRLWSVVRALWEIHDQLGTVPVAAAISDTEG